MHGLLAAHGDAGSLRWLRRRTLPLVPAHRRLAAATVLHRAGWEAGTRALRRMAGDRWQAARFRVLATERLCDDRGQARAALHALDGSTPVRFAAAIRLARVHRDESAVTRLLDDPATPARHLTQLIAVLTDGLNAAWPDRDRSLLDHGEWKRFGSPRSLSPGSPFAVRPRHPPARTDRLRHLVEDSAGPATVRLTAAAAMLPDTTGIAALSNLARDPHLAARHRRRAVVALASWNPGAALPLAAEAVRNRWLPRTTTWLLLVDLLSEPMRVEPDWTGLTTVRRQLEKALAGARVTLPLRLGCMIARRPAPDPLNGPPPGTSQAG